MKIFSSQYFDQLLYAASRSKRLRVHANVHDSYTDQCQKLFNAICIDSYIRPHRHSLDPKEECLIAVRGLFGLIEFSDHGGIDSITLFCLRVFFCIGDSKPSLSCSPSTPFLYQTVQINI